MFCFVFCFSTHKPPFIKNEYPHGREEQATFPVWEQTVNDNERNKDNNLLEMLPQKQNGMPVTFALSEFVVKLIAPPKYTG